MKNFILGLIAYVIAIQAVNYGRTGESVIELFSPSWWVTSILIIVAFLIHSLSESD